jgi:phage shock protein A
MNTVQVTGEKKMFKQIMTLARGRLVDNSQAILDANALNLLRQQMRDAAQGVKKSRTAVAVIIAYAEREKTALARIEAQINDLEERTMAALAQDRKDLADDAAHTIAQLEGERDTTQQTIKAYQAQIARLRTCLSESETCLRDLQRGQHLAEANEKAVRVGAAMPAGARNDLTEAQGTLKRLQERQAHADATASALIDLSIDANAETMVRRLADHGCGLPLETSASDVLERLKKKAAR